MAFDSYYKNDPMPDLTSQAAKPEELPPRIAEPLMFWIGIVVIAAVLQLAAVPFTTMYHHTEFNRYFNEFAGYVLLLPGLAIIPLLESAWMGYRVGRFGKGRAHSASRGLSNAAFGSIVYGVTIAIIYIIMQYLGSGALSSMNTITFLEYPIAIPIAINMVVVPIFAAASAGKSAS